MKTKILAAVFLIVVIGVIAVISLKKEEVVKPAVVSKTEPIVIEDLSEIGKSGYEKFDDFPDISFTYPKKLVLQKNKWEGKSGVPSSYQYGLSLSTVHIPSEQINKSNFDFKKYEDNSMVLGLRIDKNTKNLSVIDYVKEIYNDQNPYADENFWDNRILPNLRETNIPTLGTYILTGTFGDGAKEKIYFFKYKNNIYIFTLYGGIHSSNDFTTKSEVVADKIISSIEFKQTQKSKLFNF